MRFITEFELLTPFEIKNYKQNRTWASAEMLGVDISKAFGWKSKINEHNQERHTLEIEVFPIDKWVEFRNRLLAEFPEYLAEAKEVIINAFNELESFQGQITK